MSYGAPFDKGTWIMFAGCTDGRWFVAPEAGKSATKGRGYEPIGKRPTTQQQRFRIRVSFFSSQRETHTQKMQNTAALLRTLAQKSVSTFVRPASCHQTHLRQPGDAPTIRPPSIPSCAPFSSRGTLPREAAASRRQNVPGRATPIFWPAAPLVPACPED